MKFVENFIRSLIEENVGNLEIDDVFITHYKNRTKDSFIVVIIESVEPYSAKVIHGNRVNYIKGFK